VKFFDTTLRDGEQTPKVSFSLREKLEVAKRLAALRVDVIEAGFAAASEGDFKAVSAIARQTRGCVIASLARALPADVKKAWEALREAESPRIHIVIATSELHMKHKLQMTPQEVLERAVASVRLAKSFCHDVQFSPEDASRSDRRFLLRVLEEIIAAGATVVNITDTVGYAVPAEFADLIRHIRENVPNIGQAEISVHCHNDLGLAVANTLAAVGAGAVQIECTVNGLGERAGNASLEELVMGLNTRAGYYQAEHNIDSTKLFRLSRLLSNYTGVEVPPNKPVVGENIFLHGSGIHQHGVLAEPSTYEIISPESIGFVRGDSIVLGRLSGRHAFAEKLKEAGYHLDEQKLADCFAKFKQLCERKKDITVKDIGILVEGVLTEIPPSVDLDSYQILSSSHSSSTATVSLLRDGVARQEAALGDGPVDAAYHAIDRILGMELSLESYGLKAITEGKDALGEVTVRVRHKDSVYLGRGVSTDIIEASIFAYVSAVNRVLYDLASAGNSKLQPSS